MSTISTASTTISQIIPQPSRSVAGVVDDLLLACQRDNLRLAWQEGRCQVSSAVGGWEEWIDMPVRKSVFRAILARIATVCNEQNVDSVSPYGGEADILVGDPGISMHVPFVNTAAEQKLFLGPKSVLAENQ